MQDETLLKLDHPEAAIAVIRVREGARPRATLIWITTVTRPIPFAVAHVLAEKPRLRENFKISVFTRNFLVGRPGIEPGTP